MNCGRDTAGLAFDCGRATQPLICILSVKLTFSSQLGLPVSGIKADLVDRLRKATKCDDLVGDEQPKPPRKRAASRGSEAKPPKKGKTAADDSNLKKPVECLPRTREAQLKSKDSDIAVIGVDEAGRGPLAGPVVAAAAIVPATLSGIIDSKKITKEEDREMLYQMLVSSKGVRFAVAVVSAKRIDEINILQATLEAMRIAVDAVMRIDDNDESTNAVVDDVASAKRNEISYVVTNRAAKAKVKGGQKRTFHALIDGNKIPKDMTCDAESIVKGDGKEYLIGAASILAKVTRDRLMHEYDAMYPVYNLRQHKGYPTAAHMAAVKTYGASPIHRRTFAPLKHMTFDEDGKILG